MKIIIFISTLFQFVLTYSPWKYNGTTPSLEYIIKGRCHQYQILNPNNQDPELQVRVDCNTLWETFTKVFINKDPYKTDFTGKYDDFFKLIDNGQNYTDKVSMFISCLFSHHSANGHLNVKGTCMDPQ